MIVDCLIADLLKIDAAEIFNKLNNLKISINQQ